jgi:hypothetical protein
VAAPSPTVSTWPDNGYGTFGGTSAAAPQVAGVAGLLKSMDPSLHSREIRHLIRLGADDGVGAPGEDTPGWDPYLGFGRLNAFGSLSLLDGPWLSLDRPHYLCGGTLTVALKDRTAGSSVEIALTASPGGDSETVAATPLTGAGYYEGTIPIAWAGRDGPVVPDDGILQVDDGEEITATAGSFTAEAFADCVKEVCVSGSYRPMVTGDCDRDGALDPGELWALELPLANYQAGYLPGVTVSAATTHPDVTLLRSEAVYGELPPYQRYGYVRGTLVDDYPLLLRARTGSAANDPVTLSLTLTGDGWEQDLAACVARGDPNSMSLRINRDLGTVSDSWDFDTGTAEGFTHAAKLGNNESDLPECYEFYPWLDAWEGTPVTDRSHSGAYAMRLGNGTSYPGHLDCSLVSPMVLVPSGGGAIGFYLWAESDYLPHQPRFTHDALVLEVRPQGSSKWTYVTDATYNVNIFERPCYPTLPENVPFGAQNSARSFSGDGTAAAVEGDAFDRELIGDLSPWAGGILQFRFRFGADGYARRDVGVWVDTISLYGPFIADGWPGDAPSNLQGSDASCPDSFALSWNPVAGSDGYTIYRSDVSCDAAQRSFSIYGISSTNSFIDADPITETGYHYAVEANQAGSGCPTERSCVAGGCICVRPADPEGLMVSKSAPDLLLAWNDPGEPGMTWNVYRESAPDPSTWGEPHAPGVSDEDPGTLGIQHTDAGAVYGTEPYFYFVSAYTDCESPMP